MDYCVICRLCVTRICCSMAVVAARKTTGIKKSEIPDMKYEVTGISGLDYYSAVYSGSMFSPPNRMAMSLVTSEIEIIPSPSRSEFSKLTPSESPFSR